MAKPHVCPQCGLPLPEDGAEGLCPRCLLEAALAETLTEEDELSPSVPAPLTGKLPNFGSYHSIGVLGEGGMGIVYLAEQRDPFRRRVALKVLKRGEDRPSFVARFESERQALALMDHPNIARVYDAGATEDGLPYFAMEYVPGIPITEYCDRNLLGLQARLLLFQQVCQAVQHAHQKGIIHRDLKPSNVLVMLRDGKPVPKVIDFGVAKAVNQRLTEKTLFTEMGVLLGTPEYMSPEQAGLTGLDIDTTTDVYSLGVLLYELLVGALPFDIKTLRKAGYAEIQRVIREEEPPRLSTRLSSMGQTAREVARRRRSDVRTLARLLRGDLEWIALKAVDKDRTRRYPSASEFAADIARHLANEPVIAGPPSAAYRVRKFIRRHRGKVAVAAALLITLVAGLTASTLLYLRSDRERAAAEWASYKGNLAAAQSQMEIFRTTEAREILLRIPRPLRGWEWNYLYARSDTSIANLNSGESSVDPQIGFSTDGSRLLVSTATSVHTWQIGTFHRTADYGPFGQILTMSRDGSRILCRSTKGNAIEVVEPSTGKTLAVMEAHQSGVVHASFNADASRVATLASNRQVRVWETATGKTILTLTAPAPLEPRSLGVTHDLVTLSPDGLRVACSAGDRIVAWDVRTGRVMSSFKAHRGMIQFLAFRDNGTMMSVSESVREWNATTGEALSVWSRPRAESFRAAAGNPDATQIATVSWFKALRILDRPSGEAMMEFSVSGNGAATDIAYSRDGKYLVCLDNRGIAHLWDLATLGGRVLRRVEAAPESVSLTPYGVYRSEGDLASMALSPDGNRIAVAIGKDVESWDALTGKTLASWRGGHSERVLSVAYRRQGDMVASGSQDQTICIWISGATSPRLRLEGHGGGVTALAYSPDGTQLASGSEDRTVRIWDPVTGRPLRKIAFQRRIRSLVFSPDGRTLAVAQMDDPSDRSPGPEPQGLQRLDTATAAPLPPLRNAPPFARTAAFNSDGTRIVAADVSGAVVIWDSSTGNDLRKLSRNLGVAARSYAFSPDGTRLAISYGDNVLSIGRPDTGEFIVDLDRKPAVQLQFSPDGSRLYANGYDAIRVYDTRAAVPVEAEELLGLLRQRFPLYCDMRQFLEQDRQIEPRLRDGVLRMIEGRLEERSAVSDLIEKVLDSAGAGVVSYQQALRRARLIAEPRPWDAAALERVGEAQYRTGDYVGALVTLERAAQLQTRPGPRLLLYMSMAHSQMKHKAQAGMHLQAGRTQVNNLTAAKDALAPVRALLREAESLAATSLP